MSCVVTGRVAIAHLHGHPTVVHQPDPNSAAVTLPAQPPDLVIRGEASLDIGRTEQLGHIPCHAGLAV
jgi:hypothetical protein